jgi:type III restriction enzyme
VGPSITRNSGIIGEAVDLTLDSLSDLRQSTLIMHLTKHLIYRKFRDAGEDPQLQLFSQLKRIVRQWLDECLRCEGRTYPAQLMYQELSDIACERMVAGITRSHMGERPIRAVLDPYNPTGSTRHVNFNTSKLERWETSPERCHLNWAILDSGWEGEFCRVAEGHPQVISYVKNHNLGLEVPYVMGSQSRKYIPDYIVRVNDGRGEDDPLNLIVEIKGYRGEDAKEKKSTMDTYWVPGVNHIGTHGRWAFAEFTNFWTMQEDFARIVEREFNLLIEEHAPHTLQEQS